MMSDKAVLRSLIEAEQGDFVSLAKDLTPAQWVAASRCPGWTVHEVVLHTAVHTHRTLRETVKPDQTRMSMLRGQPTAGLVDLLASPIRARVSWELRLQLAELVIHQQDVRRALGLDRAIPAAQLSVAQRSDGAAAVVLMSPDKARSLGLEPLGKFLNYAVAGVPPEIMGIGPAFAIPTLLARSGKSIADISVVELNEAFAAQALAVIKEYPMPIKKINPNGGAVALGHPLGCTGARQTVTLLNELRRRGGGYGIVSMCIGGGMGAAGLFVV